MTQTYRAWMNNCINALNGPVVVIHAQIKRWFNKTIVDVTYQCPILNECLLVKEVPPR